MDFLGYYGYFRDKMSSFLFPHNDSIGISYHHWMIPIHDMPSSVFVLVNRYALYIYAASENVYVSVLNVR